MAGKVVPRRIDIGALRDIVTDPDELWKGTQLFDQKALANLARHQLKLFAEARGSSSRPYRVAVDMGAPGGEVRARCTCFAARSRPFCKHGAALLVAWARTPEAFAVSDSVPEDHAEQRRGPSRVKKGKRDAAELMQGGVDQVGALVRELGAAGVASLSSDRLEQLSALGESLRANRLRRLSARCLDLVRMLSDERAEEVDAVKYTDLVADMLLSAAKIGKHLAGEQLEDRYVEELIGKTWTKKDRAPVGDLDLVEYAYINRTTSDDFVIHESRFVDLRTGAHYSEKRILPSMLARRRGDKRSYAGRLLRGASGSRYPGFEPLRLDLESTGEERALDDDALSQLLDTALEVREAIERFQAHRKDVFAPPVLPVTVRTNAILAAGGRLQALDPSGHALHLPPAPWVEESLTQTLSGGALAGLLGEIVVDVVIPTFVPRALVVQRGGRLEMVRLLRGPAARAGRRWNEVAREAGLSPAAISLGEIREELAQAFVPGLAGLSERKVASLAARLGELGLAKPAALLESLVREPDAHARVGGFVKLYQLLELAMLRLAGASRVDPAELAAVPGVASLRVKKAREPLAPEQVRRGLRDRTLSHYEALVQLTAHFDTLPTERLVADRQLWGDGLAGPYVVEILARRHALEQAAQARSLLAHHPSRTIQLTALGILERVGGNDVELFLRERRRTNDGALQGLITDALVRMYEGRPPCVPVAQRLELLDGQLSEYQTMLTASANKDSRARAATALGNIGSQRAIGPLRWAFCNDKTQDVRAAAAQSLARLGDHMMIDAFIGLLDERGELSKAAAYALGHLGDVRGAAPLLAAYRAGLHSSVIGEALAGLGDLALEATLDAVEAHPELAKRQPLRSVAAQAGPEAAIASFRARITGAASAGRLAERARGYLDLAADRREVAAEVAATLLALLESDASAEAKKAKRAAKRYLSP